MRAQGFLPTLLEDVPDMAVKFAVYESLRPLHQRLCGGRQVPDTGFLVDTAARGCVLPCRAPSGAYWPTTLHTNALWVAAVQQLPGDCLPRICSQLVIG